MRLYEIAEGKGLFVCVNFSNNTLKALKEYQIANNIQNPLDTTDLHTTVVHSKDPISNFQPLGQINWQGTFTRFDIFDSDGDNCLVLRFACPELSQRWKDTIKMGAKWKYDQFRPHITLSYNAGDIDLNSLPPYTGLINIIEEVASPLDPDYEEKHKS